MNSYFFKMSREEKDNILDQHKEIYNGFATNNVAPNTQPLYTQDFANDKNGITVNNRGEVMTYKNMGINEDVMSGSEFVPEESFEGEEYVSLGEKLDMIGDGPLDLPNGTVDIDDEDDSMFELDLDFEDDVMDSDGLSKWSSVDYGEDDDEWENTFFGDDFDDDEKGKIAHNIQESLDMFNRFKKYN
jgi:hypothetical protein